MRDKVKSRSPLFLVGLLALLASGGAAMAHTITLTGTIRDFRANGTTGGHPDFETYCCTGATGLVKSTLGVDGKPVFNSTGSPQNLTDAARFNQWYNDVPGVNASTGYSITLDNGTGVPGGVYSYANSSFFPIDGQLFGDQGNIHNYHFTYEIHTSFTYVPGQVFSFTGDDDLWVFINGQLAVDLGGVHGALPGSVALDTLGLTAGNTYGFDLFFAERHLTQSNFRIDTSIASFRQVPEPGSLALAALGLLSIAIVRRRKR